MDQNQHLWYEQRLLQQQQYQQQQLQKELQAAAQNAAVAGRASVFPHQQQQQQQQQQQPVLVGSDLCAVTSSGAAAAAAATIHLDPWTGEYSAVLTSGTPAVNAVDDQSGGGSSSPPSSGRATPLSDLSDSLSADRASNSAAPESAYATTAAAAVSAASLSPSASSSASSLFSPSPSTSAATPRAAQRPRSAVRTPSRAAIREAARARYWENRPCQQCGFLATPRRYSSNTSEVIEFTGSRFRGLYLTWDRTKFHTAGQMMELFRELGRLSGLAFRFDAQDRRANYDSKVLTTLLERVVRNFSDQGPFTESYQLAVALDPELHDKGSKDISRRLQQLLRQGYKHACKDLDSFLQVLKTFMAPVLVSATTE